MDGDDHVWEGRTDMLSGGHWHAIAEGESFIGKRTQDDTLDSKDNRVPVPVPTAVTTVPVISHNKISEVESDDKEEVSI